jgi:hypothetical protein
LASKKQAIGIGLLVLARLEYGLKNVLVFPSAELLVQELEILLSAQQTREA